MGPASIIPPSKFHFPNPQFQPRIPTIRLSHFSPNLASPNPLQNTTSSSETLKIRDNNPTIPSMSDIIEASRTQKVDLRLRTVGPFFRVTAKSLESGNELGRAEGVIRMWVGGRILHLDSMRLRRETIEMEKSIFGIGLFIGAMAIRHGYDCGCKKAELLAINDSDIYHSKVFFFCDSLSLSQNLKQLLILEVMFINYKFLKN